MRKFSFLLLCLMIMVVQVWAQTREVTGRVVDLKDGSPLVGATVKLKGTTRTAVTDANGMFKISAEGANGTLQVSFVGFDEQDFSAAGNNLSIGLSRSNADLSEVVVVGYGQTVKRELTSSVAKVKGADIANMPV
jgi:hypothetical protein